MTLQAWKDDEYSGKLGKTLVIFVSPTDYIRNNFENVLAVRLGDSGIEAAPSNKVIPQLGARPDREMIASRVRELGFESVIVARAVSEDEYSRLIPGGVYYVPTDYYAGWNSFYTDSFAMLAIPGNAYAAEHFTVVMNIYDVRSEKLVSSYLPGVNVEASNEEAVKPFIETIIKQLQNSKLL
jgi:hypothetical protein